MREQIAGLITPKMAVVFMLVFLMMWSRGKMGNYVLAFAASYLFFCVGFAATHLLDTSTPYTFHVTQFFYTLSVVSGLWGLAMRVGQPPDLSVIGRDEADRLRGHGIAAGSLALRRMAPGAVPLLRYPG